MSALPDLHRLHEDAERPVAFVDDGIVPGSALRHVQAARKVAHSWACMGYRRPSGHETA